MGGRIPNSITIRQAINGFSVEGSEVDYTIFEENLEDLEIDTIDLENLSPDAKQTLAEQNAFVHMIYCLLQDAFSVPDSKHDKTRIVINIVVQK